MPVEFYLKLTARVPQALKPASQRSDARLCVINAVVRCNSRNDPFRRNYVHDIQIFDGDSGQRGEALAIFALASGDKCIGRSKGQNIFEAKILAASRTLSYADTQGFRRV